MSDMIIQISSILTTKYIVILDITHHVVKVATAKYKESMTGHLSDRI